jgi:two-component system, OmpR family, phosphate regulon sensor histidine kinase PhoR
MSTVSVGLRSRILLAIVGAVIATDLLATWAIHSRVTEAAIQEADSQARGRVAMVRSLYAGRAATLAADAERIALHPAVIAAIEGRNVEALARWGADVAEQQGVHIRAVDASGTTLTQDEAIDHLNQVEPMVQGEQPLEGVRLALGGQRIGGIEDRDEIGLAVRGYAPVRRDGTTGPVVGAVMLAEPLDTTLLTQVAGDAATLGEVRVEALADGLSEGCDPSAEAGAAICRVAMLSPSGRPVAMLVRTVPLENVKQARLDLERALWLTGLLILLAGAGAGWLLASSLTSPLARLTVAARRVARGDYTRPTGVSAGRDEIGELAGTFELMRQRVADATDALRGERDVRDAVLESTGDGIIMVTLDGDTAVANRRWVELVGADGLEAAADLTRIDGGGAFAEAAAGWLAEPEQVAAIEIERPTPEYRRLRCYSAPVHRREGAPLGRIFVLRDVTRESEAERLRNAFIATVSHDLRAPLTAVAGYAETLMQDDAWDDQTRRELLGIIAASADTLTRLVDNLLDASTLEAGVLRLEPEPTRLERIVERVVTHRRPLTPTHALQTDLAPGLPLAYADPLRVEQILTNLVDNAIKYAPDGGPVTVSVTSDDRDPTLVVAVTDCGVGLSPEQAERIFERFYRANDAAGGAPRGLGLGLFLCRRLVEAQGGRIWVESAAAQGSTFRFTLPELALPEDGGSVRGDERCIDDEHHAGAVGASLTT